MSDNRRIAQERRWRVQEMSTSLEEQDQINQLWGGGGRRHVVNNEVGNLFRNEFDSSLCMHAVTGYKVGPPSQSPNRSRPAPRWWEELSPARAVESPATRPSPCSPYKEF